MPCRQGRSCNAPAGFEKENVQTLCRDGNGCDTGGKVLLHICRRKIIAPVSGPSYSIASKKEKQKRLAD